MVRALSAPCWLPRGHRASPSPNPVAPVPSPVPLHPIRVVGTQLGRSDHDQTGMAQVMRLVLIRRWLLQRDLDRDSILTPCGVP